MRKAISGIMVALLLISALAFSVQPVRAGGTIYIRADGSIDPPTAPIRRVGNVYIFTDNIYDSIVVERDNIVIYGAGYTLEGTGARGSKGIDLSGRSGVTITNINIKNFGCGIWLSDSLNNNIIMNNITNNGYGILLKGQVLGSRSNIISMNDIANNGYNIRLTEDSRDNTISGNNIANNGHGICISGLWIWIWGPPVIPKNNKIYHNNFIDNRTQASGKNSVSVWDDGYPSGGNYWSDYTGEDSCSGPNLDRPGSDGIGDTPYIIDADDQDRYPLMNPFGPPLLQQLVQRSPSIQKH